MSKMISIIRRSISSVQNLAQKNFKSVDLHIYKKSPFSTLDELNQYLLSNVIYNEKGLLLLNKPYGLRKTLEMNPSEDKKRWITKHPAIEKIDHLSFTGVLPHLSEELHLKTLQLIKVPERYISGVSILSTSDVAHQIRKCLAKPSVLLFTYLAICVGIPVKLSDQCRLGLTIQEKDEIKKAVLIEKYSNTSLKKEIVVPVTMKHTTLVTNDSLKVSLVLIQNNLNKWHAVRAFCGLRLLAPVLGDTFYSSCVRTVCGRTMPVNPLSPIANFPSKLPTKLLSALELKPENKTLIPTHLHLSGVNLQKFETGKIFVAKPSDHFLWTCQKLNLSVPEIYLHNGVVEENSYFEDFVNTRPKMKQQI